MNVHISTDKNNLSWRIHWVRPTECRDFKSWLWNRWSTPVAPELQGMPFTYCSATCMMGIIIYYQNIPRLTIKQWMDCTSRMAIHSKCVH